MGLTLPYTRTWGNLQPLGFYLEGVLQSWIIVQLVSLKKFGSDSQMGYDGWGMMTIQMVKNYFDKKSKNS